MRQIKTLFTVTLLLAFHFSNAQKIDSVQATVAKNFLHFVVEGQQDSAWQLVDKTSLKDVTREQFNSIIAQMKQHLAIFDSFDLVMNGIKLVDNKTLSLYTFKAFSTSKNVVDDIAIDIVFIDSSKLVAGIQPKQLHKENAASTTKAKETPLEQNFKAAINGTNYLIRGINIVHFENNNGLLSIQVEMELPKDQTTIKEWATKGAVKFAKYLVAKGYVEKAKIKAKEIDKRLLEDIGVSFFDPAAGAGFNVILKPEEYR
jgi:hypothetical protein